MGLCCGSEFSVCSEQQVCHSPTRGSASGLHWSNLVIEAAVKQQLALRFDITFAKVAFVFTRTESVVFATCQTDVKISGLPSVRGAERTRVICTATKAGFLKDCIRFATVVPRVNQKGTSVSATCRTYVQI